MCEMKLTNLEKDVIANGFGKNDYQNDGNSTWSYSIIENCEIVKENQISGVIGSLAKKGLTITQYEDGEDSTISLTDAGKEFLKELTKEG